MSGIMASLITTGPGLRANLVVGSPVYTGTTIQTQRRTVSVNIITGSGSYSYAWSQIGTSSPSTFTGSTGTTSTVQQSIDTSITSDYTPTTTTVQLILTDTITVQSITISATVAIS
jgi:hypothetical protein